MKTIAFALLINSLTFSLPLCDAQEMSDIVRTKKPCIGYNPERKNFEAIGYHSGIETSGFETNCPKGYAYISLNRQSGNYTSIESTPVLGNCCPLPEDALLDIHAKTSTHCPPDSVMTGAWVDDTSKVDGLCSPLVNPPCDLDWDSSKKGARCTFINTERYQLGPVQNAAVWGWPRHLRDSLWWDRIIRRKIPRGVRHAVGRRSKLIWEYDGCIGNRVGGLFVGRNGRDCPDLEVRQLQYRGRVGDPQQGEPVSYLPQCDAISDPLDPNATCLRSSSASQ